MRGLDFSIVLSVFIGGGIGSLLRAFSLIQFGSQFYLGTLLVNLTGSFFIGLMVNLNISNNLKTLVITGVLGGLTTFSGFALDFVKLAQMGEFTRAFLYFVITNLLAIAGCYLGYQISLRS